ncbi:MAG TPA: hypothetical protein EYH50_00050 [Pyrodictium delaneyi]|uniref:Uncharacterized protein n=1 Tax=Pyrodictium delaneyi TaxID=1273541 RepID=A0A833A0M8_9CREN|nr:hypothetical protein [Pyrodictium delaneyi]
MPVDFRPIEGRVSRRATVYDVVLIVAPALDALSRKEAYQILGVQRVEIYPLMPNDAPTLFSLLGIVAWIRSLAREQSVLVEGYGGEALLEGAYRIVEGAWRGKDLARVASRLQSPLHLRSLVHLAKISEAGIDLGRESASYIDDAFTGGDAYAASVLEHAIDLAVQLGLESACIRELYSYVTSGMHATIRDYCVSLVKAAESLDRMKAGAVRTIAIVSEDGDAEVLLGCRLLLRDDECWPEARISEKPIKQALMLRSYRLAGISLVDPEEAACIAYGSNYGYECGT